MSHTRSFSARTRPFFGHSSKCEECGVLFDRGAKRNYVCPECREQQKAIVLPPPMLSPLRRYGVGKNDLWRRPGQGLTEKFWPTPNRGADRRLKDKE